ncbi:MAG TPA: zinc ribbon domain-containing protein [Nitrososphaerales archaeon]|nr:zinc ribbon domain-containing protein [Nitrososphaerales archaeon]
MSVYKREDAVGKTVITHDGRTVGVVRELGFTGDGTIILLVTRTDATEESIPVSQTAGIADYVVLRAPPTAPTAHPPVSPSSSVQHWSPVPPVVQQPPQLPPVAYPTTNVCPNCKNALRQSAKFCPKCGTKVAM